MFLISISKIITISIIIGVLLLIGISILIAILKAKHYRKITDDHENNIISHLGGKDNIISAEAKGSRLNLVLNDYNAINEKKLKENGVTSIIKMTRKITLVIGAQAKEIADTINKK